MPRLPRARAALPSLTSASPWSRWLVPIQGLRARSAASLARASASWADAVNTQNGSAPPAG